MKSSAILELSSVHLIGIGGISMSAIAHILLERGIKVSGSDAKASATTDTLKTQGATIYIGHSQEHITTQEAIIYTGAIDEANPEFAKALECNIPIFRRTEAINQLMANYPIAIAISGTHGKTSTTTMTTMILDAAQQEPSYLVGAKIPSSNKAYHMSPSDFIAVEACEYKAGFLDLHPTTLVVNNIEEEHLDFYKNIDAIVDTFTQFANHLQSEHFLILNHDDFNTRKLLKNHSAKVLTFGISTTADYEAKQVTFDYDGKATFDLYFKGDFQLKITLNVSGKHNVYNALGAIAATHANGISFESAQKALAVFCNAERRFEDIGHYNGARIVSDYAHHPSEVKATLQAALSYGHADVYVVFQPHTYSRTKSLLLDLASSFKGVKHAFITDIYAARETNHYNIHSRDLVQHIANEDTPVTYTGSLDNLAQLIHPYLKQDVLVVFMGAGDIDTWVRNWVKKGDEGAD